MDIPPVYLDQVRERLPDADPATMRLSRDSLVNDTVIVNDAWVFRFPKDEAGKQVMSREAALLDLIRRHVDMPMPVFECCTDDYAVYRFIPGVALDHNTLLRQDERTQDQLTEQLAAFLSQLHAIPQDVLAHHGVSITARTGARVDWAARFRDIERDLFPLLGDDQKRWATELFASVLDGRLDLGDYQPVLTYDSLTDHRTKSAFNILFDPATKRISGILDFSAARLGDPASDFALIINVFGERFLRRMQAFHPPIEAALNRARFLAGMLELLWIVEGLHTNDPSWFTVHIGRARDVLPITFV